MTVKYEYQSKCCQHYYTEQRPAGTSIIVPMCNACKQDEYELIAETEL